MHKILFIFSLLLVMQVSAKSTSSKTVVTVGNDVVEALGEKLNLKVKEKFADVSIVEIDTDQIDHLSHEVHETFHRCGGFVAHTDDAEAFSFAKADDNKNIFSRMFFANYEINQSELVEKMMAEVDDINIKSTILKLSSFHNRYYNSQSGVDSSLWIKSKWEELTAHRSDVEVKALKHAGWRQPSIILTIKGSSNETLVLGGHADSIAGYWNRASARAPGADDNASGISTITEVLRVLMSENYKPKKTIKFMAYSAEEVGLKGSKEIANAMKREQANIVGVVQFDMTNFKGSRDIDIALVSDYTNADQNKFMARLIDTYLDGVKWGYDRCGYACSDHASWHLAGFPASMPFEAMKGDMNRNIHTHRDTLEVSRNSTNHASKFARLGLAYIIEMDQ